MKRNRASASFMTRLGRDQRGNTIAIVAAAIVPLLGMIGGGIDMSRLYLAKTRLQQACDAGALAGRKAMGSGAWSENGPTSPKGRAEELFRANFGTGAYGTTLVSREFDGDAGTVTGEATVEVPMSVMQIFGMTKRTLSVECTAKMEIPNTDVMFVLDVTGSMNCAPGPTCPDGNNGNVPATGAKLYGLKSAVKCFYEALLKVNTSEDCSSEDSPDPTATAYTGTAHIRLGFVPYAVNVNVGKLLPHSFIADNWTYRSRTARAATLVRAWALGPEAPVYDWGNWPALPTNRNNQSTYSNWTDLSTSSGSTININGTSRTKRPTGKDSTSCPALNTIGTLPNKMLDYVDTAGLQDATATTTNNPPTYPADKQTLNYSQKDNHNVVGYKYVWASGSCRLQSGTRSYTVTRTGKQTTKAITWNDYNSIPGWNNGPRSFNVSGLKKAGTSDEWLSSIILPLDEVSNTVQLSGSSSYTTVKTVADRTVTWDGCVEERQTYKNTDGDPSNDWDPIPDTALDMDIDLVPDDTQASKWGPLLSGALQPSHDYHCPRPSRKLAEYYTAGEASDFVSYISGLTFTGSGTYHDIGMIWGARLLSPIGIFADENDYTSDGGNIQRHLIFMTDGKAATFRQNYGAYGLTCIDLRQLGSCPSTDNAVNARVDALVNARLVALCKRIRDDMNVKLWVISYGGGVDDADETRLRNCATPGHFYSADNGAALIEKFKQIASEIADLRLAS